MKHDYKRTLQLVHQARLVAKSGHYFNEKLRAEYRNYGEPNDGLFKFLSNIDFAVEEALGYIIRDAQSLCDLDLGRGADFLCSDCTDEVIAKVEALAAIEREFYE